MIVQWDLSLKLLGFGSMGLQENSDGGAKGEPVRA